MTTIGASYYEARFYSTTLGTFLSADPVTAGGLNRYGYTRGNPIRLVDDDGFNPETPEEVATAEAQLRAGALRTLLSLREAGDR